MGISPELPRYAELHCLTNFSFLRGASHPDELVGRALELGYEGLAITDECSLAGVPRAYAAIKDRAEKFRLIVGSELRLDDGLKLVLLAPDRRAYGALSSIITAGRMRSEKGGYSLARTDIEKQAAKGLLALCLPPDAGLPDVHAGWLREAFPQRAWLAAELHNGPNDRERRERLTAMSARSDLPLVAAGDVHMHVRSRRRLQDALTAIRLGKAIDECAYALYPNGERHLRMRSQLAQLYPQAWLEETAAIAERCRFSPGELKYEYPEEVVPRGETPSSHLRKLVYRGMSERFPDGTSAHLKALVERELALIREKEYEPFFLTVHDVVRFARSEKILCQGRGSAANSAVCFFLGITEIDPEKGHGLFERFVSADRDEPPDIDVDFEHERREEVIQYVYKKYGRDRTAIAATVIRYRTRSAIRDLGKVLGMDLDGLEKVIASLPWSDDEVLPDRFQAGGFDLQHMKVRQLLWLVGQLQDFPRHLSQHVGGFVISRGPLAELVPIENAAMDDRTVIQWDKDDLESLGLMKVDILALGMLTALRRAMKVIGIGSLQDIPPDDQKVYDMICRADTIGVFQIESRAQMSMLPRLRPRSFYDLVIQVAIVRPGPIVGGMVHPYLKRRGGLERVAYPSEEVKGVLERTLGVPIFQEQVMQLAIVAAGFTPGEADLLRRAMAAWKRKGGLEPFEIKLKTGLERNGYTADFADRLFKQILGFGEYGFPESHSASFAILAYASAWIKHHHPTAFLMALLNSQPMGFYAPAQLIQDARKHGVEVRSADVALSDWDCTMEQGAVRLGLRVVSGLSAEAGKRIVDGRPYVSVADLAQRAELGRKTLKSLAAAGALRVLAGHRRQAHWLASGAASRPPLDVPRPEGMPALQAPAEKEEISADYRSLGFTLGRHPVALVRQALAAQGIDQTELANGLPAGRRVRVAGVATCRQSPMTASGVVFVTLEDESGFMNVVVWNDVFERQREIVLEAELLGVEGRIQTDGQVVHLVAEAFVDHTPLMRRTVGALSVDSHDFH
jgi:error-prone DNA polymerase